MNLPQHATATPAPDLTLSPITSTEQKLHGQGDRAGVGNIWTSVGAPVVTWRWGRAEARQVRWWAKAMSDNDRGSDKFNRRG